MDTTENNQSEQPLPIPDYEIGSFHKQIFSADNDSLAFFEDCAKGNLGNVVSFVETHHPCHGDRQRGLEIATFGGHILVIRYLLENGTKLHSRVFERHNPVDTFSEPHQTYPDNDGIDGFLSDAGDAEKGLLVLQILQVFRDFGWHPNQPWIRPGVSGRQSYTLLSIELHRYPSVLGNMRMLEWLLSIGADPNLKSPEHPFWRITGTHIVDTVARMHRLDTLDLLFAHGLRTGTGKPLHLLSQYKSGELWPHRDISSRFTTAQWFIDHGFDVNSVRDMHDQCMLQLGGELNGTALAVACAKSDWDMAEWLLDRGADPEVEDRCAYTWEPKLFGPFPDRPNRLAELVEQRNRRSSAERQAEEKKASSSVEQVKK